VNSFGFGGSNAHAILESWEPSGGDVVNRTRKELALTPFIFSAGSERSLSAMLSSYADYLEANPTTNLRDLAWTLASRRSTLQVRAVIAGATLGSLQTKLDTAIADISSIATRIANIPPKARYLGVFTGQGAQWTGMGRGLILASDAAASVVRQLEQSLAELPASDRPDWSLMSELLTDAKTTRLSRLNLNQAVLSQPLCTAVQIILIDHLRAAGIQFDAVVGHSSGEIAAAYAAGYLTARDAIRIAYYRGLHAKLACGPDGKKGAMMAVGTSMDDANELCQLEAFENRICVAASNSSASVTLSGDADAIQEAKVVFDEEKKFSRLLKVDTAYHSHHMLRCSDAYMRSLQACNIQIQKPNSACVWISSVYGEAVPDIRDDLTCQYWNNNMVRPVLFSQAIECAIGEKGPFDAAVEVGPHPALKGPATQTIQEMSGENIHYTGVLSRDKDDVEAFAEGLGYIWTHLGEAAVDFNGYDKFASDGPQPKLLKNLPAYPWDHDRQYWSESRLSKAYRIRDGPFHELLGFRCADGTEREIRWRNLLRPKEVPWLYGHQIQGQMVFPGAGYISTAVEAVKAIIGKEQARIVEIHDLHIGQAAIFDNEDSSVETLFVLSEIDHAIGEHLSAHFSFYSSDSAESTSMTLNARGRIQVTFGSSMETALPSRGPECFNMIDVNADRFYETLAELGFNYSGEFKNLSKLRRKLGMATGTIINPASSDPERALLVHPAMLDGAIQSIILAYCWPGDGRLRSIHVPVRIRRVAINIGLCNHDGNQTYFPFDSSLGSNTTSEIDGDVDIFTPDGRHCMIQVEGMRAVPFSGSTAADDFHLFSDLVWNVANPDANSAAFDEKATSNEYELAYLMERVAYFYTRALHKAIGPQQRQTWEWHHEHLFRWGTEMIQRVKNGVDENIKKEWDNDSHEDILAQIARYPESIDLKVMHAIGENMPAVVRGETTILEHLMKDNLLNDYYVNALGFHQYTNYLARMVGQIVHRYPRMNILEVGAGTGGATKSIFKEIGSSFMSYTFTDISSGFFEKAQEVFNDFSSQMVFKALNAEQDIENQGFVEHSYDLIIASLVIHATKNLERTLSNVRRLLKPGGYLVLLEITNNDLMRLGFIFGCLPGWWLGVDDNRTMSPCIPTQQWDTVLRKAGFAGVETTTPDSDVLPYPLSVICAQAIDERIEFLREPLLAIPEQVIQEQLTVIGGNTLRTAPLAKSICALLPQRTITSWLSLEEFGIEELKVAPTGTVLSLVDLDDPIFKSMTAAKLKGLKALFEQFRNILWVTSGARSDDPYSNMIIGFGRCVLLEMPHIRLQFLDLDKSSALDPRVVADTLVRFETVRFWEEDGHLGELLWSVEPEIAIQQHQQLIPRLKLNKTRNSRYNSSRRLITKKLDPRTKAVKISHSEATYELQEDVSSRVPKTGRQFIQVLYSVLQPLKVAPTTYVYLVLGRSNDGRQVLSFSRVQSSIVEVSDKWIIPCPQDIEQGVHFMSMVAIQLIVLAMLKDLAAGDTLVVLEPPRNLANALSHRASEYGINAVYLTTNSDVIQDPSWIPLHANFPKRAIKAAIPSNATYFEDMSGNEILAAQVTECLPPLCKIGRSLASVNEQCQAGSDDKLDPILALLKTVWFRSQIESSAAEMETIPTIPLDTIPHGVPLNHQSLFSIVDWNIEPSIDVKLQPVDARPLFSPEKTYWLVGLTGGLGQSLCQWMIEHGARHIVITSRHPNVDSRWKESMERLGAVVQIIAKYITLYPCFPVLKQS
jgi:hybrid polyketide synthase/nonribosomal peptide synthetase ACE1